jgi:hypothetical protein
MVILFMGVHDGVQGRTAEAVAGAYPEDLWLQGQHGVHHRRCWVERHGTGVLPRRGRRPPPAAAARTV